MPRKQLIETDQFPYHITNRSNNREFFYIGLEDLWSIFIENLQKIRAEYGCELHAFVLMGNHYHLLVSTPNLRLSAAMTFLHREVARHANRRVQRTNHFFGGRYKWCLIENEIYYWNTVKYIFQNPMRSGICQGAESYRYSSLNDDKTPSLWTMTHLNFSQMQSIQIDLEWLNHEFKSEEKEAIKKGLHRRRFTLPLNKNRNKIRLPAIQPNPKGLGFCAHSTTDRY